MNNGEREWQSELSTIDTTLFIVGALTAASYFTKYNREERELRDLADKLYCRIDWQWALNNEDTISHGWKPESGFLPYRWDQHYAEAHIMYILALGSPTFPIKQDGYIKWTNTFDVTKVYDISYLYAGPLFIHQFSHMWIDFREYRILSIKKQGLIISKTAGVQPMFTGNMQLRINFSSKTMVNFAGD